MLVIVYIIWEQLCWMESPKIKNKMNKILTAAIPPVSTIQGNIIMRDYIQNMAPHRTTEVKLPGIG